MVSKRLVDRILKDERGYIDEQLYLDYLVVMIAQIAEEGDVVILGRGSQYILNDHPDAYHVLMINDFDNRVRFMMEQYEFSASRAAHIVNREDKRRLNLYRTLGKTDYDDAALYHMVLNMGRLSMQTAVRLVYEMVKQ
jgi:cytidylate kinase